MDSACSSSSSSAPLDTPTTTPYKEIGYLASMKKSRDLHRTATLSTNAPASPTSPHASPHTSAPPVPPPKPASVLFAQGLAHLSPATLALVQAHHKFEESLYTTPASHWHARATCLNNMAVCKRQLSCYEEALGHVQEAWGVSVRALVDEKERLCARGMYLGDGWMDLVIMSLDLDKSQDWVEYVSSLNHMAPENDKSKGKSPVSISTDIYHDHDHDDDTHSKTIHGPPLVVLFLDLLTNMGNILYNLGQTEDAIASHSNCLRLAETVFEYFPLDPEFRMSFPLSIAHRFAVGMMGASSTHATASAAAAGSDAAAHHDPNFPNPSKDRKIQLSYLHRSIIHAQARSLTHLAACCQILGLDDAALQCNSHALEIVAFYQKVSVVGSGGDEGREGEVGGGEGVSGSSSGGGGEGRKSVGTREGQWKKQQVQLEQTQVYNRDVVDPLKATVLNNFAVSYYAKGRLAAAFDHIAQSATLYTSLAHPLSHTRVVANLHALKLQTAVTLQSLHWIRNMESQAIGQAEVAECTRYWGPPRMRGINLDTGGRAEPDTFANTHLGSVWAFPGLKGLRGAFLGMKDKNCLLGMLGAMVNMATAHLINGQPYIALYILGSLITEETASGLSLSTTPTAVLTNQPKIPEPIKLHVHYTLCQSIFLLLRLQRAPSQDLFPQAIFFETDDTLLFCTQEPLNALLPALDLELYNVLDLDMLAVAFLTAVQDLQTKRDEIREDIPFSMLYPYIGESGFFGQTTRLQRSLTATSQMSGGGSGSGRSTAAVEVNPPHAYGLGVGLDFFAQQSFLVRGMMGKNDWTNASGVFRYEGYGRVVVQYQQGIQKLDSTVRDVLRELRAGTGDEGVEEGEDTMGLIKALHESTMGCKAMPPFCVVQMGGSGGGVMRFTSAIQGSSFLVPVLFAISADVMAYGAYQMQTPRGDGGFGGEALVADLLGVLRIPTAPAPAKVHKDLLEAAGHAYRGVLGMCEVCLKEMLVDPDKYGELVFVSRSGAVVGAGVAEGGDVVVGGCVGTVTEDTSVMMVQGVRGSVDLKGRHMFPCRHYYN
ncbi:hypothetical protein HDU98_005885 [Podochytrium sp. JEL0797]|nr:hypothetical protein HDU98_005885 [Podochytrium sp. JEL0797]